MPFPFYKQLNAMDCGLTYLRMAARYYGKHYNIDGRRQDIQREGLSLLGISLAAEKIEFRTWVCRSLLSSLSGMRLLRLPGTGIKIIS